MTNPNFDNFKTLATTSQKAIYLSEGLSSSRTTTDEIVVLLADALECLTEGWSDEEKEDGGLIRDHLADDVSRANLAKIPHSTWQAAWDLVDSRATAQNA